MAQADGRVVIETKLDNSGMIAGEKEVEESLRRMAESVKGLTKEQELALQKQIDSFAKLNTQYAQQEQKVKELQSRMEEYAQTKIPTEEYKDLEKQIDAAYEELDKLVAKQEEYKSLGVTEDMMPQTLINDLDQAGMKVGELEEKLLHLQETGEGFTLGMETEQYAQQMENLNIEEQKLLDMNNRLGTSYESITAKMEGYSSSTTSAASAVGELARDAVIAGIKKLGSALKTVASNLVQIAGKPILSGVKKLTSAISGAGNSASKAGASFKRLLGYGLGFRSLYTVFSKLKSYVSEGLDSLSEYSEETKASLTSLDNSLTTLKNSLAVAFAPILNYIVPVLQKLINWVVKAANYVSMFFALLSGQSTYTAATPVTDYNSSVEDTASAANDATSATNGETAAIEDATAATEEAEKVNDDYLSGLDEINKFETKESSLTKAGNGGSGGSGSPSSGSSYSNPTSTVSSPFTTLEVEPISFDSWGEAFDKFLDYLLDEGIPALQRGLTKLADWINTFAANLYEMFTFPGVLEKVRLLGTEIADCFNDFVNMIDWDLLGRAFGAGLNLVFNWLESVIYEFDWQNLGAKLATFINGLIDEIDFENLGKLLWSKFKIALETLAGFLENLNMPRVARSLSDMLIGWYEGMIDTITSINWAEIGNQIQRFIKNIKWGKIGQEFATSLNEIVKAVEDLDLGVALGDLINGFFTWAINVATTFDWTGLGDTVADAINDLLTTTDWGKMANGLYEFAKGFLDSIIECLANINWVELGQDIMDFILGIDWLELAGQLITIGAELVEGLLEGIAGALMSIGTWISENVFQPIVQSFKDLFGINSPSTVFAEFGKDLIQGLINGIQELIQNVVDFFVQLKDDIVKKLKELKDDAVEWIQKTKDDIEEKVEKLKDNVVGFFTNLKDDAVAAVKKFKEDAIDWFKKLKDDIEGKAKEFKDNVVGFFSDLKEKAVEKVKKLKEDALDWFGNLKKDAEEKITGLKDNIVGAFDQAKEDAIQKVKDLKKDVVDKVGEIVTDVGDTIDGIKEKFRLAFEGIKTVIKAPINAIIGFCNRFISGIVTAINNVISALNKVSVDIPSWVPGVGGQHFGISIPSITSYPQISYLASGAVIPPQSEFLAVLGDQKKGNNIEAPEALLRQIVREETANNKQGGQYEFTAQINRRTLFDEFIDEAKLRQMQTGKNPLMLS